MWKNTTERLNHSCLQLNTMNNSKHSPPFLDLISQEYSSLFQDVAEAYLQVRSLS